MDDTCDLVSKAIVTCAEGFWHAIPLSCSKLLGCHLATLQNPTLLGMSFDLGFVLLQVLMGT